jgi:ferric-dicitrate binding protein FerR (iron transport regulator)
MAFQATPLREVAKSIERAYGVRVTIADSAVAGQTVTTWFSDAPLEEVVRVTCAIVAAECAVQGSVVTMGKLRQ